MEELNNPKNSEAERSEAFNEANASSHASDIPSARDERSSSNK